MSQMDYNKREQKSPGRRVLTVAVLVVVLCVISFSLGLMVGKSGKPASVVVQTVPLPPQPQVASQPEAVAQSAAAESEVSAVPASPEEVPAAEVANTDPLRELLPPVEQMPLGSGINQAVSESPADTAAASVPAPVTENTTPAVAEVDTVSTAVATIANKVSSEPLQGYVVQVASFKNRTDADVMSRKLADRFPVVVRQADLGEKGTWFRVLVGPVATKEQAELLKQDLKKKASTDGFIKKISG